MRELVDRAYVRVTVGGQRGQGMLEYALILSFVSLVVIAALVVFGPKVGNLFNEAGNQLTR